MKREERRRRGGTLRAVVLPELLREKGWSRQEVVKQSGYVMWRAFSADQQASGFFQDLADRQICDQIVEDAFNDGVAVLCEGEGEEKNSVEEQLVAVNFISPLDDGVQTIGPVSVLPECQGRGAGRLLMEAIIQQAHPQTKSLRLVVDSHKLSALSLYASFGFDVKEAMALMQVTSLPTENVNPPPTVRIRRLTREDIPSCERLAKETLGVNRGCDLRELLSWYEKGINLSVQLYVLEVLQNEVEEEQSSTWQVEGCMTGFDVMSWSIAQTEEQWEWLLLHALKEEFEQRRKLSEEREAREPSTTTTGEGEDSSSSLLMTGEKLFVHVPKIQHPQLFRRCLDWGWKLTRNEELMVRGEYSPPVKGRIYFPSIIY
ncbi:hypothetical protein QOT17_021501 [Balamuthia mandrillaris]